MSVPIHPQNGYGIIIHLPYRGRMDNDHPSVFDPDPRRAQVRRIRCQECQSEDLTIVDVTVVSRGVAEGDDLPLFDAVRIELHCGWACPLTVLTVASGKAWPELRMKGYETPLKFFVKNHVDVS